VRQTVYLTTTMIHISVLNEHRKSLLVSGEAIRLGVGTSLFMARLGVFSYLACCAWSCRGRTDAEAAAHIHACIDRYDADIGSGLLHQGRATLEGLRRTGVMIG
jgi:hypothetical protein